MNNGPSSVTGVKINDSFPVELSDVTWSCEATPGSYCEFNGTQSGDIDTTVDLNPAGGVEISAVVKVKPEAKGVLSNSAFLISPINPLENNKTATDLTTVVPKADLFMDVQAPISITTSTPITYTIAITNSGPSTATKIILTDILPKGVNFYSSRPGDPKCSYSDGEVTCDLGSLPAGDSLTIWITVISPKEAGIITNKIEVKAQEADPNPDNNEVRTKTLIV